MKDRIKTLGGLGQLFFSLTYLRIANRIRKSYEE